LTAGDRANSLRPPALTPEDALPDDEPKHEETQPEGAKPGDAAAPSEGGQAGGDAFNPEAIAARVARLGAEDDVERVAREEEAKLHERKAKQKTPLESAASKRLAKIGEGKVKRPSALIEGMAAEGDPFVRRAAVAGNWIQQHQQTFAGLVAVALLGLGGFAGYTYWQDKRNSDASALLAQALDDERGHISDKAEDDDDDTKAKPLYPTFKTAAERRDAALAKYRDVESKYAGTGAAILARLAEAALLLDAGDAKTARADFEEVTGSPLGKADTEVRGRALEGIGFADEALAVSDPADKAKHLEDALATYKKLADVDATGLKELGQYHQSRVLEEQGDKAKAIELLKDVQKRVSEPGDEDRFSYLKFVVEDRLRDLDPTALPPKTKEAPGGKGPSVAVAGGGANKVDMNDPQIKKILEQLRAKSGTPPLPPAGGVPAAPPPGGGAPVPVPPPPGGHTP
jgi:hypothetical protein